MNKTADFILELGPEGGVRGGEVVASGTPEQVVKDPRLFTGHYLRPVLERAPAQAGASGSKAKVAAG